MNGRSDVDRSRRRLLRRLAAVFAAAAAAPVLGPLAAAQPIAASDAARRDAGPDPRPVDVGVDRCPYCSMSVVDARFAAQQVTATGRVHVYDAIECLVDHLAGHAGPPLAAGWCYLSDHAHSSRGEARFIGVHAATVLHHARFRTPMGGGLVAFADAADAAAYVAERGVGEAEAWDWDALVERSREQPWVPAF